MLTLGQRIRQLRQNNGKLQGNLANFIPTAQAHVSAIEHDKSRPSSNVLSRIAVYFNMTEEQLLEGVVIEEMGVQWVVKGEEG